MLLMFCAALVLGACEYVERPENAAERRFTWFSYPAGEDLKESCRSHGPPRYRFIYNAIFSEQVRTYEINGLPDGGGGMIDAEILPSKVSPDFLLHFPNWPWSGKRAVAQLNDVGMNFLRTSLEASGFFDSPPLGKILDSHSFYWLVSACEGNRFHLNAWVHPSPEFANIRFVDVLHRLGGTKVALPKARDLPAEETEFRPRPAVAQDGGYFRFFAEIVPDGLRAAAWP
ncbi:MAG: hypothetical protein VCD31_14795 [Alphaproteobacteria bacterium]